MGLFSVILTEKMFFFFAGVLWFNYLEGELTENFKGKGILLMSIRPDTVLSASSTVYKKNTQS